MMLMRSWKARANPTAATSQDSGKAVHFDTVWQILDGRMLWEAEDQANAFGLGSQQFFLAANAENIRTSLPKPSVQPIWCTRRCWGASAIYASAVGLGFLGFVWQQAARIAAGATALMFEPEEVGELWIAWMQDRVDKIPVKRKNNLTNIIQIGWNHQLYSFACENQSKFFSPEDFSSTIPGRTIPLWLNERVPYRKHIQPQAQVPGVIQVRRVFF